MRAVNVRDFCGGARLRDCAVLDRLWRPAGVARMQGDRTALHLAAVRGRADLVAALLRGDTENEHDRDERTRLEKEKLKSSGDLTTATEEDTEMKG